MTLPHNEQKHNTNQLFLQHIGNLAYHRGNTATNYGSVNSLTTHNNQYTLLYPDLVQELFNFTLHNSNSVKNNALSFGGLDVNNEKYSSLGSSLSSCLNPSLSSSGSLNSSLSPRDILFFLQIISLYQLELSKGNTYIAYPSLKLAKLLGVDAYCDTTHLTTNNHNAVNALTDANKRATILKMTARLEALGLLKVFRRKRKNGMDMTNKLVPVLPDKLHTRLKDLPSNLKVIDSSKLDHESNLEHILRTKLFVPIELDFMKSLFKNDLPSKYKLFFLNCIMSAYRNFRQNSSNVAEENTIDVPNIFSFSATSPELIQKNNISYSTLKRIFKYVKQQGDSFFLQVEHKYTKSDDIDSNRYDKSIFVISINPLVFPISHISQIKQSQTDEITNYNCDELQDKVLPIFPDTYKGFETGGSKKQPRRVKKTALNNKEEIIKNKDIDNIDVKSEEEFLEDKLCLSSSKSYNNSSFLDVSSKSTVLKKNENQEVITDKSTKLSKTNQAPDKTQHLELRHFYPLSEKDSSMLNFKANREFSTNFTNQLLLKLYIKDPEKRFKNKFTFWDYMIKALKNELNQGPLVNNPSFRFSCNIDEQEKRVLECEQYLIKVESSSGTCKISQVRKKIAGRFSTEIAYKILTKVQFKTNNDNSFITVLIPNSLALSERQIEILSDQLEAVYGVNGYYVQEVEKKVIQPPKSRTSNIEFNDGSMGILDSSNTTSAKSEEVLENTVWDQIRKTLREELGEHIDQAWFAKASAIECKETKTMIITMPTRFMTDWVRNHYSHVIRRISEGCGIKMVEYGYE